MIEMTWGFFWFAVLLPAIVTAFVAYWLGRDAGEKATFMKRWSEQTDQMERLMRLSAENKRLRTELEQANVAALYPEGFWNNVRVVPEQPGQ